MKSLLSFSDIQRWLRTFTGKALLDIDEVDKMLADSNRAGGKLMPETMATDEATEAMEMTEVRSTVWYCIRRGETLDSLAEDFDTTPETIMEMNDLEPDDYPEGDRQLNAGMIIRVPAPEMVDNPSDLDSTDKEEGVGSAYAEEYDNGVKIREDGRIEGLSNLQRGRIARLDFEARWFSATAENPYGGSPMDRLILESLHIVREHVIEGILPDSINR